jgi:hypothetical protein
MGPSIPANAPQVFAMVFNSAENLGATSVNEQQNPQDTAPNID